ncbi:MAG: NAD(P)/FAD-dependent oxidoreductase [Acidobacteriales bacterium]|nr:NAD(P)/FAD-dependent oxidoreductase [Terriglobales bacterium]
MNSASTANHPHVVIVGAGFGGLYAAKALGKLPVRITIVDRKNHHTFQPLLYQVATAGLSPGDIATPIRRILRRYRNVEVLLGEVVGFDLEGKSVSFTDPTIKLNYDYLVVATGVRHSYFSHPEWEQIAPGLKTVEDALEIRRQLLLAFEQAERQQITTGSYSPLNFVVVGGGPTGVELAGAMAEIARRVLAHDFRGIDPTSARVILLEGGPRVLPTYPEDLSQSAEKQLRKLGVEVRTNAIVTSVEPGAVRVGTEQVPASLTLWAAGVAASPLGAKLEAELDRAGRVKVRGDLSLPAHPEVFVIGDLAAVFDEHNQPLPGVAPVAIQQGNYLRKAVAADFAGKARPQFHYLDKGSMATIGRAAAVAMVRRFHFSGLVAWLAWLFIHILYLIGFRNRVMVILEWAWAYIRFESAARLITDRN